MNGPLLELKRAGFMEVKQPRRINAEGKYVGLRAVRVVTCALFEWLGLGPMLKRERKRALERLKIKAMQANQQLKNLMRRMSNKWNAPLFAPQTLPPAFDEAKQRKRRQWTELWKSLMREGLDFESAWRQTNQRLGYPSGFSPGML